MKTTRGAPKVTANVTPKITAAIMMLFIIAASPPAVAATTQSTAQAAVEKKKEPAKKKEPYVILRADEVTYDEKSGTAVATGNVEIAQGARLLRADKVTYHEASDTFSATGHVVIVEPNGDVLFGEHGSFTNQFKDGFIRSFAMLFVDNSRIAANRARRTGGVVTTMHKAVYSPCKLCEDNPERAPLWRLRAVTVIHDGVRKEVEYKDAFLEMFGVPVFYLPYLTHPDPTVKRRSGVLTPSYSTSTDFGLTVEVPYFWAINPSEDITFYPKVFSEEAPLLAAEYRRRFAKGEVKVNGSFTQPDARQGDVKTGGTETRGHLFVNGQYHIDPIWRARVQLQHSSDDTYMRRYQFEEPSNQTLTTSFNLEGFKGHNFAHISGYSFQALRENDDPGQTPLVLPFAEYNFISSPQRAGSYFTADASLLAMHRDEGTDSRRLSLQGGWHLPYTAPSGEVYELSARLQSDLYWVDDVNTGNEVESGLTGRIFPQLMFKWRFPMIRRETRATQILEPVAAMVLSPNGGNPSKIPNEDSQDVEFDETNLFSPNRFTGVDRVDSGQRFIYGLNWGLYGDQGGALEAFVGQSYRLRSESVFNENSGLRDQLSDIVGRLRVAPADYLDLLYRVRMDPDTFKAQRNDLRISAGKPWLRVNMNYLFVSEDAGTGEFNDREEVTLGVSSKFTERWNANASIRENLASNGGTLSQAIGLTYNDECLIFNLSFTRSFTTDRDLKPKDTLFFRVTFKNLGEFKSGG